MYVKVKIPNSQNPLDREVDTVTLVRVPDPGKPSDSVYQINDKVEPSKRYIFLADPQTGKLILIDSKPVVNDIGNRGTPKVQSFGGEIRIVEDRLNSSNDRVQWLDMQSGNLIIVTVDRSTLT